MNHQMDFSGRRIWVTGAGHDLSEDPIAGERVCRFFERTLRT